MKISFISLGCPKNQVDLEYLIGDINAKGHTIVTSAAESDAVIINTCGFIEPAVKEAISEILAVRKETGEGAKLIVTGCMVERYKDDFAKELPEVDFFTGVGKLGEVIAYLEGKKPSEAKPLSGARILANAPYYAYLKISEGCNNRCAYCTIPDIRGPLASWDFDGIVSEAAALVKEGVRELIIVSQDTTKYGEDKGEIRLIPLLSRITAIPGDFVVRLMYLNPDGVTEEIVKFVAENEKMLPYFEIPVQHASARMLKLMRRRSTPEDIRKAWECIRTHCPGAFIRTTAIVGFPGETEEDFNEMLAFFTEMKPDFAGFFPYHPEDGTPAATMPDRPDAKTVKARMKALQSVQKKNTVNRLKALKKTTFPCYVERESDDFAFILEGRAQFQAPEIDGKLFVVDGVADRGYGPYECRIQKIVYPDVYVELIQGE